MATTPIIRGARSRRFSDIFNNNIFYLLNQNTYSVMENPILVAIPLFLFMGYVVERANIVDKLFFSLYMAARNLPGSLAIAALLTCAVFSTASGIVGAVVTLMGLLGLSGDGQCQLQQELCVRRDLCGRYAGHSDPAVDHADRLCGDCGSVALASLRGGGFPGLVAGGSLYRLRDRAGLAKSGAGAQTNNGKPAATARDIRDLLVSFVPLTVLIALVLGSILGGLATPAEAAAMGALGGMVLAVHLSLHDMDQS